MATHERLELPGYTIEQEVGSGGQARVYRATQESFQRKVAIKALLPSVAEDPQFTERFLREAHIVASLSHPYIIPVYDFGQKDDTFYMVMEYLAGGNLKDRIKQGLEERETLRIVSQLAQALGFAHSKGYIHRDIKPDNVMFREDGSAVLTDFGIARLHTADTQVTMVGQVLGTPKYMSPEQIRGKALDGRTDIYALGIMFYQMLTKEAPYSEKDFVALAAQHCNAPIPKFPKWCHKYQNIFERMVAKDKEKRFQTGEEISRIFEEILSGKISASSIDNADAAAFKKAVKFDLPAPGQGMAAAMGYIPRTFSVVLQDVDPLFDEDWSQKILLVLKELDAGKINFAFAKFLTPKGIYLNKETRKLFFIGKKSLGEVMAEIRDPRLRLVARNLEKTEEMLRATQDVVAFTDLLESSLSAVEHFDCKENLATQKKKSTLRAAYLYDLVLIVREANFQIPNNQRGLTDDMIKDYLIQVYLRQRLLGYHFKTLSSIVLEKNPDEYIRKTVARQARIRQCDIVETGGCLFLIGPTPRPDQNPYSIRRFMHEETVMRGQVVFFNAVAVPFEKIEDMSAREHITWTISRIVTLERMLSEEIKGLITELEKSYYAYLVPILDAAIEADGTDIKNAIEKRALEYELKLTQMMLSRIHAGIYELAQTKDDFEYLYFTIRRLMVKLACDVKDFNSQFAAAWSSSAEDLDLKLSAYISLLDKLREEVFTPTRSKERDPLSDPEMPAKEFNKVVAGIGTSVAKLKEKLAKVIRKEAKPKSALWLWTKRVLKLDRKQMTADMVENELASAKQRGLVSLIRICKRYTKVSVYLESEDLVETDESKRHYALPSGKNGLSRLPILITLYEDKDAFDVEEIKRTLDFDILKNVQAWDDALYRDNRSAPAAG